MRAAAEKLKANGVSAPLGLKTEPGFFEHWRAMANKLYVNNSNGRKARATKTVFDDATGRQIFTWLAGMVKDGLADDQPRPRHRRRSTTCSASRADRTRWRSTPAPRSAPSSRSSPAATPPTSSSAWRRSRRRDRKKGGVLVSGGELFMVNKSAPEKQAAAWQYLKFLDSPESLTTWAIGTGYLPIRKASADEQRRCSTTGSRTRRSRSPTTSSLNGPTTVATSGSVIGNYTGARDAVRDAENSMFLNGTDPKAALKEASKNATAAIAGLQHEARRGLGRRRLTPSERPRSSIGTYGRSVGPV